jgi:antitoxin component HigA of HigAB toxin-antitoxin module
MRYLIRDIDNKGIQNEEEYELVIAKIEELWDSADGTPEAEQRDFLMEFVSEYESRYEDWE